MDTRPWTVKVLVAWEIVAILWGLLSGDAWQASDFAGLAVGLLLAWGMWTRKRWAYIVAFAVTLLSGLVLAGYVVTGSTRIGVFGKIVWVIFVAAAIYLLRHPATKRFIDLDDEPLRTAPLAPPDRGGRWAQASAISVFGALSIAIPLLWATGMVEGLLLIVSLAACAGAGIAVLVLGLPARDEEKFPSSG